MDNNEHSTNLAEVGMDCISRLAVIQIIEKMRARIGHNLERSVGRAMIEILDEVGEDVGKLPSEHGTNLASLGTDCISRRQAIETFKDCAVNGVGIDGIVDALKQLPSAQPEIIRCTECKHYREYDSKYVENAVVVQCMADRYPISETIPDGWFCAGAERKDDE